MRKTKAFDCVAMKDEIQRKLREQHQGMTDAEVRDRFLRKLETSDSSIARWWRTVRDRQAAQTP